MTVIDPTGQITIDRTSSGDRVFVRLPLAGGSEEWIADDASREATGELLDAALALVEEAQAVAAAKRSVSAPTEQYIRDWWESRSRSD